VKIHDRDPYNLCRRVSELRENVFNVAFKVIAEV